MRRGPLRWAGVSLVVAAGAALLPACGDDAGRDGGTGVNPDGAGATSRIGVTSAMRAPGPEVALFIGELGQSDKTVCVAAQERRRGTNVVTVRDHSRQHDISVVKYADGHREDAGTLAARLSIDRVVAMDAVTPTLFAPMDVAVIIAGDHRCSR